MNKKWLKSTLFLLFAMSLVLAGCGSTKSPAKATEDAMKKMLDMKSYGFEMTFKINDLQAPESLIQGNPQGAMAFQFLKNAKLTLNGKAQLEPYQIELEADASVQGDLSMNFKMPMMVTNEKLYMKLPNVPFAPVPAEAKDKFIEVDLTSEGIEMPNAADMKLVNKFYADLYKDVVAKFDEKTFYSNVKVKDAKLPEDVKAKQVVKFSITNENLDKAAKTTVREALPALLNLVAKDEYSELMVGLDTAQITEANAMLKEIKDSDIDEALKEIKKVLKINDISILTAIDKDGYPVYTSLVIDVNISHQGETMKVSAQVDSKYKDINKKQTFKPLPKDAIKQEDLQSFNF